MKIAIITGSNPFKELNRDGAPIIIFNYINYLSKKCHTIDVFLTKTEDDENVAEAYSEQKIIPNVRLIKLNTRDYKDRTYTDSNSDLGRMENSIIAANILRKFNLKEYDIVHIFHMAQSIGPILKLGLAEKTIISPMMPGELYKKYQKVSSEYIDLEKRVCKKARYFQVLSRSEGELIKNLYGAKKARIFTGKCGLDSEIFKFKERRKLNLKKLNIISANAIRPQKNQTFFIGFVKKCLKENIYPIINIAGNTDDVGRKIYDRYKDNFLKKIKREKLEKFFKIHGYLKQTELNSLAKSMDLAIYPSLMETFGMAVLESICMGIPTIVFNDVPAFKDFIIHKTNGIVAPRNAKGVIKAVKELADDKRLYRYISIKGKQMRKNYSWDKITSQLLNSYETVLSDNCE